MEQQNPRGAPVYRSVPGANIVLETQREERQASSKLRKISRFFVVNIGGIDA